MVAPTVGTLIYVTLHPTIESEKNVKGSLGAKLAGGEAIVEEDREVGKYSNSYQTTRHTLP